MHTNMDTSNYLLLLQQTNNIPQIILRLTYRQYKRKFPKIYAVIFMYFTWLRIWQAKQVVKKTRGIVNKKTPHWRAHFYICLVRLSFGRKRERKRNTINYYDEWWILFWMCWERECVNSPHSSTLFDWCRFEKA